MQIIKCINCGIYNKNRTRCKNCNTLLSHEDRRDQTIEKEKQLQTEKIKKQSPGFIERLRFHRLLVYRIIGWVLYSGFVVVSAIGAFIAWLVFAIAAG